MESGTILWTQKQIYFPNYLYSPWCKQSKVSDLSEFVSFEISAGTKAPDKKYCLWLRQMSSRELLIILQVFVRKTALLIGQYNLK